MTRWGESGPKNVPLDFSKGGTFLGPFLNHCYESPWRNLVLNTMHFLSLIPTALCDFSSALGVVESLS